MVKWNKNLFNKKQIFILALGYLSFSSYAFAGGTAAGTTVDTDFTIDYQIGSTNQTQITGSSASFMIGRKIDLTMSEDNASVNVTPNASGQVMTFTLTNNGNGTQGYRITTDVDDTSGSIINGSVQTYIEDGTTVGFQSGEDTLYSNNATSIGDLAPDASKKIYVVATIRADAASGETATISLIATTTNAGSDTITTSDSGTAWSAGSAQTAFNDGDGAGSFETTQDGKHAASSNYSVGTATLSVEQDILPLYDYDPTPVANECRDFAVGSAVTNAKILPAGCVHFTYRLLNTGNTAASNVVWTIQLPPELTFAGELAAEETANDAACTRAAGGNFNTGTPTALVCNITTLPATNGQVEVMFRAMVD